MPKGRKLLLVTPPKFVLDVPAKFTDDDVQAVLDEMRYPGHLGAGGWDDLPASQVAKCESGRSDYPVSKVE